MKRRHATSEMIRREAPDVFGVQEGLIDQLHYIDAECPQYARVGVGRDDGKEGGEIMAVFYLRDRFRAARQRHVLAQRNTRQGVARLTGPATTVTWVELKDRKSGKEFYYFNTHLDHKGKAAREEGVKLLIEKDPRIAGQESPGHRRRRLQHPVDSPDLQTPDQIYGLGPRQGRDDRPQGDFQRVRLGSRHHRHRPPLLPRQAQMPAIRHARRQLRSARPFRTTTPSRWSSHFKNTKKSRSANSGIFRSRRPPRRYPFPLRRTTTDTAATISRMPAAPLRRERLGKTQTPITTAVSAPWPRKSRSASARCS